MMCGTFQPGSRHESPLPGGNLCQAGICELLGAASTQCSKDLLVQTQDKWPFSRTVNDEKVEWQLP